MRKKEKGKELRIRTWREGRNRSKESEMDR